MTIEYKMNHNPSIISFKHVGLLNYCPVFFLSGRRAQQANASVRAAFVHVVGDLLQSVSVLVSAIIIFFKVSSLYVCTQGESVNNLLLVMFRNHLLI